MLNRSLLLALAIASLTACQPRAAEAPAPAEPELAAPANEGAEAKIELNSLLPGAWVSVDDAKSVVTITPDGKFIETYDGTDETTSQLTWVSTCKDAVVEDAGPYLVVTGGDLERCFKLLSVSADQMELMYVGRGNVLAYTRIHD